ncbi:MAG: DEAD/DEAH box helicase [Candidatus Nealsonbacteria bacterium]|nr:DEAD/DEAH box helicase [Candidatus Nealsonbacteria bacterium]
MYTRGLKNYRSRKFLSKSSQFKRGGRSNSSNRGQKRSFGGEKIDPAKFINKAVMAKEIDIFKPEHEFQDFKIDQRLKQVIAARGYKTPTPIQDRVIPCAINGSDIVGVANTGTGKTAAFLLPLINKIILNPKEQVLIIAPTRELALQIDQEFKLFTKGMRLFSVCCVGGMSIGWQISNLHYQYNVIIGTPGRLKDLIERKMINLSRFNNIVLDEADRMLDMGFINDTRFIMSGMPKERQVFFFAATLSSSIEKLIKEFLRNPIRISVKTRDTAKNVEQDVIRIERGRSKLDVLNELLNKIEFNKVLIFGKTKRGVEGLSKTLSDNGFKVESIHGNKNNSQRQRALVLFKNNVVQVLVATDVAARGLDIADISHVINYDIPATYTDYVHRIGRTGRGDKRGTALTFIE